MKEITRIHLAQTPFNIEIAAKKALQTYLEAIEKALDADDDALREIEARIVELLSERGVSNEKVITVADVKAIEQQLGAPSEFVDEDAVIEEVKSSRSAQKRLMRDVDAGLLGGVCAGIARYFAINPMWLRLAAIVLILLSFGTALLVYMVLWLAIPAARTAAEKLQMRGEPVTLAALKTEVADEKPAVPEKSKPLVIVLRVMLVIGFVSMAIGALMAMIFALGISGSMITALSSLPTNQPLMIAAIVAGAVSGLLFIVLMLLGTYATAAWRITKRLAIAAGSIAVLGIVAFSMFLLLGVNGSQQLRQDVERLTVRDERPEAGLKNIRALTVKNGATAKSNVPLRYVVTTGEPRIEVQYLKGQAKPTVQLTRQADTGVLSVTSDDMRSCLPYAYDGQPCLGTIAITVYGPNLQRLITTDNSSLSYATTTQDALQIDAIAESSRIDVSGRVDRLSANLAKDSKLDIQDAAVKRLQTRLDAATLKAATVEQLQLSTPVVCGNDTSSAEVARANRITVNGQAVDMKRAPQDYPCLQLEYETDATNVSD